MKTFLKETLKIGLGVCFGILLVGALYSAYNSYNQKIYMQGYGQCVKDVQAMQRGSRGGI